MPEWKGVRGSQSMPKETGVPHTLTKSSEGRGLYRQGSASANHCRPGQILQCAARTARLADNLLPGPSLSSILPRIRRHAIQGPGPQSWLPRLSANANAMMMPPLGPAVTMVLSPTIVITVVVSIHPGVVMMHGALLHRVVAMVHLSIGGQACCGANDERRGEYPLQHRFSPYWAALPRQTNG